MSSYRKQGLLQGLLSGGEQQRDVEAGPNRSEHKCTHRHLCMHMSSTRLSIIIQYTHTRPHACAHVHASTHSFKSEA